MLSFLDPGQPRPLRIGTRGSQLARWQSDWVAAALLRSYPTLTIEIVEIKTQGDRDRNSPLSAIGGMGLFTKEIQRAVIDGLVDIAVHSLKDLPTATQPNLLLGAVPPREDVFDAFISTKYTSLSKMPPGGTIGTGSLRRRAMVLNAYPEVTVVGLRGNVGTRLSKALDGELDAVILASAGLNRLGLDVHISEQLRPPQFLPAVGQGALGIECREDDPDTIRLLQTLDDVTTRSCVVAERSLLAELEGGCIIPLGAFASISNDRKLHLQAAVFDSEGRERISGWVESGSASPVDLGKELAEQLKSAGAERLLKSLRSSQTS